MRFRTLTLLTVLISLALPMARALAVPAPPAITAPAGGSTECFVGGTTGAVTVSGTATVAEGETVTIRLYEEPSDAEIATGIPVTGGTWSTEITFADGVHEIYAKAYDSTSSTLSEPSSPITFTVDAAVRITDTSRTPATISPANDDGVKDTVLATATAGTAGTLRFRVYDGATLVRTSPAATVVEDGDHSWTWNGKDSGGAYVPSGPYTIRTFWTAEGCPEETSDMTVTVDNIRPNVASHGVSPQTFYPAENDELTEYRDTTSLRYTGLTEPAGLKLMIYRHDRNEVLRSIARTDDDGGSGSITWNGRTGGGNLMPEGRYDLALRLRDGVGNVRTLARRTVRLSHDVLRARTATITKLAQNSEGWTSNSPCAQGYESQRYAKGVLLEMSDCLADIEVILIVTNFSVPGARHYEWVKPAAYGRSTQGNTLFAMVWDFDAREYRQAGTEGPAEGMHWFNTKRGSQFVRDDGRVRVSYFIGDQFNNNNYDFRDTSVRVRYGVLV